MTFIQCGTVMITGIWSESCMWIGNWWCSMR